MRQEKARKKLQSIRAKKKLTKISKEEKVLRPEELVYRNKHKKLNYVNFLRRKQKNKGKEF